MKLSLQTKIVLPSVLVFVLAFGFSGWNSYSRAEKALREAVVAMLEGNLRSVSMGLRDYKQGILDDLRGNTTITPMRMLYSADRREAGKESVRVSLRNRPLLRDGVFLYVDATDENGRVLAAATRRGWGCPWRILPPSRPLWTAGTPWEQPCPGRTKNALVPFAVPVILDGKTRGVLMAMVDFSKLGEKFVAPIRIGKLGYAFVATGVGEVMYHPDGAEIMVPVASTSLTPKMVKWRNGIYEYSWSGQDWIALYETDEQSNWTVIVKAQGGEVFAAIHDIAGSTIMLTVGSSVFFCSHALSAGSLSHCLAAENRGVCRSRGRRRA